MEAVYCTFAISSRVIHDVLSTLDEIRIINHLTQSLSMPNRVHCAHILVRTEKEAKDVLERLNKGEKFANIAKEVSQCPSRKRGGDLGFFGRGKMVKEFETAAFNLHKGQTSSAVKTKFGYHIIKRLE